MSITTILFDLDGTLLPMDQDEFTKAYFALLAKKAAGHGYDPQALVDGIWKGTAAMVKNDGSCLNEEAFWRAFCGIFGEKARLDEPMFDEFYRNEFEGARAVCGFNQDVPKAIELLKQKGYRLVLATNPLFPAVATRKRIGWAGLSPEDFELYTTYENFSFCKPNPEYYREIARRLNLKPDECIMVGNDVAEDMIAQTLGMKVFLLTDCLLNRKNADISGFPQGNIQDMLAFIEEQ